MGAVLFSCKKTAKSQRYVAGEIYYGSKNYVKYIAGDAESPIILSSPHDGTLDPDEIPDRNQGTSVRDIYASDLTLKIADSIKQLTGLRPHVIINDLKRIKLEPNRSLTDAQLTNEIAVKAYNEYHGFIQIAQNTVKQNPGKGLYFDMHGHAHDISRIEIGYLLSISQLNGSDNNLNALASASSIYHIFRQNSKSFSDLIRGANSLGTMFQEAGLPAIPSSTDPHPLGDPYFNGGYCTLAYGSINGGSISAIQLETPGPLVRNNSSLRSSAAGKMARVIDRYVQNNLNL